MNSNKRIEILIAILFGSAVISFGQFFSTLLEDGAYNASSDNKNYVAGWAFLTLVLLAYFKITESKRAKSLILFICLCMTLGILISTLSVKYFLPGCLLFGYSILVSSTRDVAAIIFGAAAIMVFVIIGPFWEALFLIINNSISKSFAIFSSDFSVGQSAVKNRLLLSRESLSIFLMAIYLLAKDLI